MRRCDLHALLPRFVLPQPQMPGVFQKPVLSTADLSVSPTLTLEVMGFRWRVGFKDDGVGKYR